MDAWAELESRLTAARVPRSLWPRYWEKEKYKKLRQRLRRDSEEYRSAMERSLERDHSERRRQREFAQLLIILLWLLDQDAEDRRSWTQRAWSTLRATPPGSWDGEYAQRLLAGLTLAKCDGDLDAAEAVLKVAGTNLVGQAFPLPVSLKYIEQAEVERQRLTKTAPTTAPAPATGVSPNDTEKTPQISIKEADPLDELTDEQLELAAPSF
jgi:hypothetical protein